jgi:hypothetical protein
VPNETAYAFFHEIKLVLRQAALSSSAAAFASADDISSASDTSQQQQHHWQTSSADRVDAAWTSRNFPYESEQAALSVAVRARMRTHQRLGAWAAVRFFFRVSIAKLCACDWWDRAIPAIRCFDLVPSRYDFSL